MRPRRRCATKIQVINPNTSALTTARLRLALENIKGQETELVVINPTEGPAAIESDEDEALAIPSLLELVIAGARARGRAARLPSLPVLLIRGLPRPATWPPFPFWVSKRPIYIWL